MVYSAVYNSSSRERMLFTMDVTRDDRTKHTQRNRN